MGISEEEKEHYLKETLSHYCFFINYIFPIH